jgi:hypothetical protein
VRDVQDARDEAARQAARLRRALGWLAVLAEPGREAAPPPPLLTDEQRRLAAVQARQERADRVATLAAGGSALAPSPAPLRVAVLDAQITAGRVVARVTELAATTIPAPTVRPHVPADVVAGLDWLAGPGPVGVAAGAGVVVCRGVVWELEDQGLLVELGRRLAAGAARARAAAGIGADRVVPFPGGRCPVCRSRSLELDRTLPGERWWVVRCISASCRCQGPGCACGQRVRYAGRRHVWTFGEFAELEARIAAARGPRVSSGRRGRGAW